MKYNSKIHHRRSIRLKGYDYSQAGAYFITICCKDMKCFFGKVENNEMILNEFGQIAFEEWVKLTDRFAQFELDVFQIMPNHMHGILVIKEIGTNSDKKKNENNLNISDSFTNDKDKKEQDETEYFRETSPMTTITMGDMMGGYKSIVANECLKIWKSRWTGVGPAPIMGKLWHRNLYEHILRNEHSY
ncbi:MAG: hypothetical protein ABIW47_13570 [Ginsengibacter sp.]